MPLADRLDYSRNGGLVTVVAQDAGTGAVLMVAYADREAIERTEATGEMHYRSRTRGLWRGPGGNVQRVVSLEPDCDSGAVPRAPAGPACHNGGYRALPTPARWTTCCRRSTRRSGSAASGSEAKKPAYSNACS